jgi:hypothetical protein
VVPAFGAPAMKKSGRAMASPGVTARAGAKNLLNPSYY